MSEKLYAVDTWDDLDDIGQHYIVPKLYHTIERAEQEADRLRSTSEDIDTYAMVVEFEVVSA